MPGYVTNIEEETINNKHFRKVLFTAPHSQLVVMSLNPGEEIGEEIHDLDQFIRIETGQAEIILGDEAHRVSDDYVAVIPAGTRHNVANISRTEPLKLYTIYSPPEHEPATLHRTKREADEAEKVHRSDELDRRLQTPA
ncbi:MAG: cupin domain-containing protein [Chloroflexi bacterium]|nr:cupin domain-containing protein [Chloroflexota bacterium]